LWAKGAGSARNENAEERKSKFGGHKNLLLKKD